MYVHISDETVDVEIDEVEEQPSPHVGRLLKRLRLAFDVVGEEENDRVLRLLRRGKKKPIEGELEAGVMRQWRNEACSYGYIDGQDVSPLLGGERSGRSDA